MNPQFLIMALPRSRTAWLSQFLSNSGWYCGHEQLRYMRSFDDFTSWLSTPKLGSVETAIAPFWRLIPPHVTLFTIRRPSADVIESLMRVPLRDGLALSREKITKTIVSLDAKLNQIEARMNVVRIGYDALGDKAIATALFSACTGEPCPEGWFEAIAPINVQVDLTSMFHYAIANQKQMNSLASMAKVKILAGMAHRVKAELDGITFALEPFDKFLPDARELMEQHLMEVGEHPSAWMTKNLPLHRAIEANGGLQVLTARSNGRMFGYLLSVISPSLEADNRLSAVHSAFYADPSVPRLGFKLKRMAIGELKARGVAEIWDRAGPRGSGPRSSIIAKRLGFTPDGELFRLMLEH